MNAQEKYARALRRQNALMYALLCLSVAYMVAVGELGRLDSRTWTQTALNVQKVFFVWQGYMIWRIARNRRLLCDAARLREHMVRTRDERLVAIAAMAGRRFIPAYMIVMSMAAVTATFFDMTVFYTLYGVLLCSLALWGGLYIWAMRAV